MNASLRLMRSSRSISYWDLGATGMFDGILTVTRELFCLRRKRFLAARGLSTRFRSSVRCREAARGDGGLCGLFPDSWREFALRGVRRTVLRSLAPREEIHTSDGYRESN